jgi:Tol biopolymer transport system component
VWLHDESGDHQVLSEGDAGGATFSADGKKLDYVMDNGQTQGYELWVRDVASGTTERVLPGYGMQDYSISADGKEIAFAKADASGRTGL